MTKSFVIHVVITSLGDVSASLSGVLCMRGVVPSTACFLFTVLSSLKTEAGRKRGIKVRDTIEASIYIVSSFKS